MATSLKQMVSSNSIKDAVNSARNFLADLLAAQGSQLLLEEAELDEKGKKWLITFSYTVSYPENPINRRVFKTVIVDRTSGVAEGVRIRAMRPEVWS